MLDEHRSNLFFEEIHAARIRLGGGAGRGAQQRQ